ncbi:hypothetical protein [Aggregatibacter segnis]|uniref:hypothetical protein n=1 Tax=Aggregatibacter segnis TaxID=739 RepID=UPI000D6E301F|nr:hypothetical protein [Aggregatibacter segnis]
MEREITDKERLDFIQNNKISITYLHDTKEFQMVRVIPGDWIIQDLVYTKEIRAGVDKMIAYNVTEQLDDLRNKND